MKQGEELGIPSCFLFAVPWELLSPSFSGVSSSQWTLATRVQVIQVGLWVWQELYIAALLCLTLSDLHPLFRKTQIPSSHPNLCCFNTMKSTGEPARNKTAHSLASVWGVGGLTCTAASFYLFVGIWEQFLTVNLLFLFFFADDSCPKAPEIANGHVEHLVRYQCNTYYRLRTEGDGKTWTRVPVSSPSWHFHDGCSQG